MVDGRVWVRMCMAAIALSAASAACVADGGSQDNLEVGTEDSELKAPLPNFRTVSPGLYRGGHPSAAGIQQLKALGIKLIVSLEIENYIEATPWEIQTEITQAQAAGITVLRYPMSAFEPAVSTRFDTQMTDLLAELKRASTSYPIYVHCRHGRDRTGLVIGLHRVENEGWTAQAAFDEMVTAGFRTFFLGLLEYFERRTGVDVH